jgi:hypothetical protein
MEALRRENATLRADAAEYAAMAEAELSALRAENERLRAGVPAPEPPVKPEWCPVCHSYHVDPGVKTDAGRVVRDCPRVPAPEPTKGNP